MQKITPCLWFDGKAEEAANFYVSIFADSKITGVTRYGEAGPGAAGTVLTVTFQLAGQDYIALNGGPQYKFTPALSLSVTCQTQDEVDRYWEKLTAGGEAVQCGWLTDRYGVSWQIVPAALPRLLGGADGEKSKKAMNAMLKMKKLDIAALERAAEG
ncbi:MAG: VOC family protein [Caulobacteraceae bacterium]